MNTTKLGWIGLGRMGIPMLQQLIKAGYAVNVYNRSKEKEDGLKDVTVAANPAVVIDESDIVFVMVSDDQAIRDLFSGSDGLLNSAATGKVIVNMSTVSPAISKEMAALCQQKGNWYIDAPVSGSVKQAEEGTLVIMVGGEQETFNQVKPVLEKLGKLAMLVGPVGAGNTAKLAVNTLLSIHAQGLAEAVAFAETNGIKPEDMMHIVNNSALGNPLNKIKGQAILDDNYKPAFALKHIAKDLRLAKDLGLASPLGEVAYQTFQQAESTLGEEDIIAVMKQIRK
jgi:3-hydroxyisobutyrate dehydrogenase